MQNSLLTLNNAMGIDVYMLFGKTKVEDRNDTDYDGRCDMRESYGGGPSVSKLLFPEAFKDKEEEDEGVEYYADMVTRLFISEGIALLRERYSYYENHFMWALRNWTRFLLFMKEQEECLRKTCKIWISS